MNKDILMVISLIIGLFILYGYINGGDFFISTSGGPYLYPRFEVIEKPTPAPIRENLIGGSLNEKIKSIVSRNKSARENLVPSASKTAAENKPETIIDASLSTTSPYKSKIDLNNNNARETDVKKENLIITVIGQEEKGILITGWKLKNSKGEEFKIGKGTNLVFSFQVNQQEDIILNRSERVYIITGRSPVGTSFKVNKCTGYFQQFQEFIPSLNNDCPRPKDENITKLAGLNDVCLDYIETLSACRIPLKEKPFNLDNKCLNFIEENVNYNACVRDHKLDKDFYKDTWMIYLNRDVEIWKNKRETITLYDQDGNFVDSVSY